MCPEINIWHFGKNGSEELCLVYLGTCVSPLNEVKAGKTAMEYTMTEGGQTREGVVAGGAEASTRVVLERHLGSGRSLVRCFPKHGRMHQIRVHLAALGHPILGDKIYGLAPDEAYDEFCEKGWSSPLLEVFGSRRQMLHAAVLTFEDPQSGERRVEAPLPDAFLAHLK